MATFFCCLTSILLPFILFSPSIALRSDSDYNKTCPPSQCGYIKEITFPFSNNTECGLATINCYQSVPTIEFDRPYTAKNISYSKTRIVIQDHVLLYQLKTKDCNFQFNFTELKHHALLSIDPTSPNISFINCKSKQHNLSSHSHSKSFRYRGCKNSHLYYEPPTPKPLPLQSFLPECSVFQFPVSNSPLLSNPNWTDARLLSLLSEGFTLKWDLPPECNYCRMKGGPCRKNGTTGNFRCCCRECRDKHFEAKSNSPGNQDKKENAIGDRDKKETAIGVGAGVGGSLLLAAFLFIIYRYQKRFSSFSSTLLSQTISSDPSSKHDLENSGAIFQTLNIFTYKELEEATNNFDPSKELGDGGFGTVYHGKLRDGRFVAVKRLYENNCKRVELFINEVEILSRLRHQHLVSLYGCTSRHSRELLLVYEFIPNGTVADHIHGHDANTNTLSWSIRLKIAIETADAIAYLHASEPQIIHRDIKTKNILLDNYFHVKVADFGLSRLFPTDVTHVSTAPQGSPGYVDPDYHHCYQLTDKSDVYSFGVVLIELISSKPAVDIKRHRDEINLARMAIHKIYNHSLHELVDPCLTFESDDGVRKMITLVAELAFRCLQMEKDMRPSMEEVLEILRVIEREGYELEKTNGADILSDDIGLLNISSSPVFDADKWFSRSTTPSNSG